MITLTYVVELLMQHFEGDEAKVAIWLDTKNPLLGGVKPLDMIAVGRGHKLVAFILDCIEGNKP